MRVTTKDIIRMLPFQDTFKEDLLNNFDALDPDRKFTLEQALWDAFYASYQMKLQDNMRIAMEKAKQDPNAKLDEMFYSQVKKQTEDEMMQETLVEVDEAKLDEARHAMELIIKEIQAAKKH
jgi:hypothetical protein